MKNTINSLQFTDEEIKSLRYKAEKNGSIIHWLKKQNEMIFENPIRIQKTGLATWALYYYCPKHSTRLIFDINKEKEHCCPVDGEVLTGEPYDGAWWRLVNERNATACYHAALIWMLTDDEKYREFARTILLEYAKYYEGYEVHGDIPHNGPGKANCQTLNEASWILALSYGYDIIKGSLTDNEQKIIEDKLLLPCAEFMTHHRTNQLHNHEIYINSAIGVVGLLLNNKELLDFAIYNEYGQIYQLENGVLEDNFWFEGSTHYHLFGLIGFFNYEIFARHSEHSNLDHSNYKRMLEVPLKIIEPDDKITLLNDMFSTHGVLKSYNLYEFAYGYYKESIFCSALNTIYKKEDRQNIHAFLYGADKLEHKEYLKANDYHNASGSGITTFNGKEKRFLLIKHGPFGGEHDHYDRLGLSFMAHGERIAPDLGTTGYGALLHYDFYKNTGTHNTVTINEGNQPPANGRVIKYEKTDDYILLDTAVDFDDKIVELDTHTRVEWDEDSYKNAKFRRIILWLDSCFIEVFVVNLAKEGVIDWNFHICGELSPHPDMKNIRGEFSTKKPYKYFKNVKFLNQEKIINTWQMNDFYFRMHSQASKGVKTYFADGPDNPSVNDISYMVQRSSSDSEIFAHVMETQKQEKDMLDDVNITIRENVVEVTIKKDSAVKGYTLSLKVDGCTIEILN